VNNPKRTVSAVHRALLERWRTIMNLVGPGPVDEHFEDCRRGLDGLDPTGSWVDLGSGAGFPGLVFADLFPALQLDLVDSRKKRCTFLERVVLEAGIGERVRVHCERVEDLPASSWDGVTARAFAPPDELGAHAARLLRPGGRLVMFLQLDQPLPAGWTVEREHRYTLPDGRTRRTVTLRLDAAPAPE
jgi:16S rRNA (guanine527-N7)-methyltransferase